MEWIKIIISATALIFIAVIVYKSVFAGIFHRREPNMYVIVDWVTREESMPIRSIT